jgi:hypothetical protein
MYTSVYRATQVCGFPLAQFKMRYVPPARAATPATATIAAARLSWPRNDGSDAEDLDEERNEEEEERGDPSSGSASLRRWQQARSAHAWTDPQDGMYDSQEEAPPTLPTQQEALDEQTLSHTRMPRPANDRLNAAATATLYNTHSSDDEAPKTPPPPAKKKRLSAPTSNQSGKNANTANRNGKRPAPKSKSKTNGKTKRCKRKADYDESSGSDTGASMRWSPHLVAVALEVRYKDPEIARRFATKNSNAQKMKEL